MTATLQLILLTNNPAAQMLLPAIIKNRLKNLAPTALLGGIAMIRINPIAEIDNPVTHKYPLSVLRSDQRAAKKAAIIPNT